MASCFARSSGWRSGAITAASATRSVLVAAAMAEASTIESGQAWPGPGFPERRSRAGCPSRRRRLESGPSTTCSLSITVSTPACSAWQAIRTSAGRSRGDTSVQFSLSTKTTRASATDHSFLGREGGYAAGTGTVTPSRPGGAQAAADHRPALPPSAARPCRLTSRRRPPRCPCASASTPKLTPGTSCLVCTMLPPSAAGPLQRRVDVVNADEEQHVVAGALQRADGGRAGRPGRRCRRRCSRGTRRR